MESSNTTTVAGGGGSRRGLLGSARSTPKNEDDGVAEETSRKSEDGGGREEDGHPQEEDVREKAEHEEDARDSGGEEGHAEVKEEETAGTWCPGDRKQEEHTTPEPGDHEEGEKEKAIKDEEREDKEKATEEVHQPTSVNGDLKVEGTGSKEDNACTPNASEGTLLSPRSAEIAKARTGFLSRRGKGFFGFGSKPEEMPPPPESTPARVPIAVDGGRAVVVVECPDHMFQRTLRTSEELNLNEVLAQIVKKNPFPDVTDYSFFVKDNKSRGPLSKLEPLKNLGIEPMTVLQLVRTQIILKVLWEDITFSISMQPESTIKQTHQQIQAVIRKKTTLEKPNEYGLFYPMDKGGEIMLEEKRTIASYRLNSQTLLYYKKASNSITSARESSQRLDKLLSTEKSDEKVYLVIESPSHGLKKTLSFSTDTQVMEVIRQFNRYCKAENISNFYLAAEPTSSGGEELVLDNMQRLQFYNFGHLARLYFKEKVSSVAAGSGIRVSSFVTGLATFRGRKFTTVPAQEKSSPTKPVSVFGVDPTTLPMVEDNGFQVPSFLAQMRKSLYEKNALLQEGLFRIAGDEIEMNSIKKQLNEGAYTGCIDVNAVSTLVKRWFGGLPVRVFAALPKEEYDRCVSEEAACKTFPDKLAEPQRSLFLWFADILIDVAKLESINKMTPGNLAVVTAPILAHSPEGNPIEGLIITGHVVNILTIYLKHRLSEEQANGESLADS